MRVGGVSKRDPKVTPFFLKDGGEMSTVVDGD